MSISAEVQNLLDSLNVKNCEQQLNALFERFDEFSAMDLQRVHIAPEVMEAILKRISSPQLRRLERHNSVRVFFKKVSFNLQ